MELSDDRIAILKEEQEAAKKLNLIPVPDDKCGVLGNTFYYDTQTKNFPLWTDNPVIRPVRLPFPIYVKREHINFIGVWNTTLQAQDALARSGLKPLPKDTVLVPDDQGKQA